MLPKQESNMFNAVYEYRRLWIWLGLEYGQMAELSFKFPRVFAAMGRTHKLCHNTRWRARCFLELCKRRPKIKLP